MAQFLNTNKCIVSEYEQGTQEWLNERKGMITASKRGSITYLMSRLEILESNSLPDYDAINNIKQQIKDLCEIIKGTKDEIIAEEHIEQVQYGLDNEERIRQYYSQITGLQIYKVGLCKSKLIPIFGGSPDGVFENGDILEIKTTKKPVNSNYKIPISHQEQMLHCMFVTSARQCHYIVYSRTSNNYFHTIYKFDKKQFNRSGRHVDNFLRRFF